MTTKYQEQLIEHADALAQTLQDIIEDYDNELTLSWQLTIANLVLNNYRRWSK